MKLADYAQHLGVGYETAWRWVRDGNIQSRRIGPHTSISTEGQEKPLLATAQRVAIYARVSSAEHKRTLATAKPRALLRTARHAATRWQRWSKRSGPASMTRVQTCLRSAKSSPSA